MKEVSRESHRDATATRRRPTPPSVPAHGNAANALALRDKDHCVIAGVKHHGADVVDADILITGDKNLTYQQNLSGRQIAIVILSTHHWATLRQNVQAVNAAVSDLSAGMFVEVDIGRPPKRRRAAPDRTP